MVGYVNSVKMRVTLEKLKKYRYPALILALGVLLLLLPTAGAGDRQEQTAGVSQEFFDLTAFTQQAETLLSQVQGAGELRLLLTLETEGTRDYLMDRTERLSGDNQDIQTQAVLIGSGSGQAPVPVQRQYPEFRGAVILCQGAGSPEVTLALKEALSSLTGLGMDKITVCKMN